MDTFDDTEVEQVGVFLQDRISITEQLRLIGGIRYSRVEQDKAFTEFGSALPLEQDIDTAWTSQLGLLYTPFEDENIAFFASRTSSFLAVIGSSFGGAALDPERGTQYEVGVKGRFMDGTVSATIAGFHITRSDVSVADRNNPGFQLTVGEQVSKGVEVSVRAKPSDALDIYAAYAYTDSEVTEDEPSRLGKPFRNVPKNTFAFNISYDLSESLLEGLSLAANANYVGSRSGDLENNFTLPSYWRVDASTSYAITEAIDLRFNVENLFNETYYSHAFSEFEIWRAAPRTWRTSITARF
ncbi:MAG: TonB-dependent receptor [Kordiimonadaceae bacterium]|nr:TonB-dependent receptor [Kordiimonadaceae bacterium]